jgi:hypothetical protein
VTAVAWLDMLSRRLGLDDLERRILTLALFYELDERVEHLADAINTARGGPSACRTTPA